jgi:small subunit ribosomal protein S6
MRKYELVFIVRTDLPEDELGKLITQMEGVVNGHGGKMETVDRMGRRRLAYRVQRQREGLYVRFVFDGTGETTKEFERRLKVTDAVIKYLTVRIDEEMKRAEKAKAWRAQQAARKPRPRPAGGEAQAAELPNFS